MLFSSPSPEINGTIMPHLMPRWTTVLTVALCLCWTAASTATASLINRGESWPRMPNYDIWGSPSRGESSSSPSVSVRDSNMDHRNQSSVSSSYSSSALLTATRSLVSSSSRTGESRRNGKGERVCQSVSQSVREKRSTRGIYATRGSSGHCGQVLLHLHRE